MIRSELFLTTIIMGFLIINIGIRKTSAQINWPEYGHDYYNIFGYSSNASIGTLPSIWGSNLYPGLSPSLAGIWDFSLPQTLSPSLPTTSGAIKAPFQAMNPSPPPISPKKSESPIIIKLTEPRHDSNTSIEKALLERRSTRDYKNEALSLEELSQLLWAAQGITAQPFYKTAPSAGALYPLDLYVVTGNVENLTDGIYKYRPQGHELALILEGDKRNKLYNAALSQSPVKNAPAIIVLGAIYSLTTQKYGERGIRYVHIEVGNAAQNIYLQAVSLNLGTVIIGAFHDEDVKKVLNMQDNEEPLALMPIGKK